MIIYIYDIYVKYSFKMRDQKKNILNWLVFLLVSFFVVFITRVYAADTIAYTFSTQSSTGLWSSNSVISVDSNLSYVNKWGNSSIIGNYFTGYYYDSMLWYFQTNVSPDASENVRVIGSTGKCATGYWYKLWWYAYSETLGYVDFDYDSNTYVYYCEETGSLFWYAYSGNLWYQNFEWISFEIETQSTQSINEPTGSDEFRNDTTTIVDDSSNNTSNWESQLENSNFNYDSIQNDFLEFNESYESLFYIIK